MRLVGFVLGSRYTIEREIGRGGMATVWLADDPQHGRKVAIKTLHPELAGAIGTDRFLREIRLTAELQHPNIVPILDSGTVTADGLTIPWYAMPFLEGESLRQRLNREAPLPIDESLRIATDAGRALRAAHQRNIVHRDIKPENIFLSGEHVYVVDFGVAKAIATTDAERLTSTGLAIGTPTYMSPEQAVAGTVDARSDEYSLASVLYEMLAGEPPFAGPNQQATIARRLAEPARPLSTVRSTVPSFIERAVLRALERTPADRFPSVDAFLHALESGAAMAHNVRRPWRVAAIGGALAILAAAAWGARAMLTKRRAADPEVVALYQRGIQGYDKRTAPGAIDAIRALNAAIGRDSSFAPAWNALAKTYVRAFERGFEIPDIPAARLIPLAVEAVEQALTLDNSSADTWTTHGVVRFQVAPWDVETPRKSLERSLTLDSLQPVAWHFLARAHAERGDLVT
ncbi:MAG TPA: serine/threonine-protein kinase, partial [Gemmatimonadaceae bacterium]